MTAIRLPVSFVLSACTTVLLFWFLGMLISVDPGAQVIPIVPEIKLGRLIPDTESPRKTRVKPPIVKPEKLEVPIVTVKKNTELIRGPEPSEHELTGEQIGEGLRRPLTGGEREFTTLTGSDHGPVPQVRIPPDYPAGPKERGIEGWITFRFTVATDGSVKEIAILDSQPPRVWDSATIRAVSSWKYQPAMKDGRPVEQVGVTVTYRYELER
jgi:protein TonB